MTQRACFIFLFGWLIFSVAARADGILSDQATAAVWTVGPGKELYAAFGHTALRITDPVIGVDRLYNFGTFNFATPHFYLKFIHGDLDYFLTASIAPEILEEYRASGQLVVEQELNLSPHERDTLFLALEENLDPANAAYRYDFVRDNCTTRIRDAVAQVAKVRWAPLESKSPTLRQMVQPYVADRPAIKTGINLLLGANMDHRATALEAMFLPEDMKIAFDGATIHDEAGTRQLVKSSRTLLAGPLLPDGKFNWVVLITYGLAAAALVSLLKRKFWPLWIDVVLFCITGLIGCFLVFLWLGTRHWVLHQNWHLTWAWPTHLIIWLFPRRIRERYWMTYVVTVPLLMGAEHIVLRHSLSKWEVASQFSTFSGCGLLLVLCALALRVRPLPLASQT